MFTVMPITERMLLISGCARPCPLARRTAQTLPHSARDDGRAVVYGSRGPSHRNAGPMIGFWCQPRRITSRRPARSTSRPRAASDGRAASSRLRACWWRKCAQRRQTTTSGWLPKWTISASAFCCPQHQHVSGSGDASCSSVLVIVHRSRSRRSRHSSFGRHPFQRLPQLPHVRKHVAVPMDPTGGRRLDARQCERVPSVEKSGR